MPRSYLFALMAAAALAWLAVLWLNGVSVPAAAFLKPFAWVESLLLTLIAVFDRWAWRWRILRPWFVSTPDLQGTWKGEVRSSWAAPGESAPRPPLEAYLAIRQTYSSMHVRLMTRESESVSLAAGLVREPDGRHTVSVAYRNTPPALRRSASSIHNGGMLFTVRARPRLALEGEYWTDRDTKGELRFTARSGRVLDSFDAAAAERYG